MSVNLGIHINRHPQPNADEPLKADVQRPGEWDFSTLKLSWLEDGTSEVCFFLPKDPTEHLESVVRGIFESCPDLRGKFLAETMAAIRDLSPEANGIDPDYEAAWDAHCDARPIIDDTYPCEFDDCHGHCGLRPDGS
jgi:hypothetical protein